jgi:hypothetical protein
MQTRQYVPATVGDTRTILLGRNRLSSLATPPALAATLAARPATQGTGRDFLRKTLPAPANTSRPGNQHPRLK